MMMIPTIVYTSEGEERETDKKSTMKIELVKENQ